MKRIVAINRAAAAALARDLRMIPSQWRYVVHEVDLAGVKATDIIVAYPAGSGDVPDWRRLHDLHDLVRSIEKRDGRKAIWRDE